MSETRAGGEATRRWGPAARLGLACALLLLGHVAGRSIVGAREKHAIEAVVLGAAEDVANDRIEGIWERLAPSTVAHHRYSHSGLLKLARWMKEKRATEDRARVMAAATEKEHGATLDEILESDPGGFWVRGMRRALRGPGVREELRGLEIGEVRTDGKRAAVEGRLPSGATLGFHLVLEEEAWRLVDFVPRPTAAGAAGAAASAAASPPVPASAAR